jgi:hypothetical protein
MVREVKIISNNYDGNNLVITIGSPDNNSLVDICFDCNEIISFVNNEHHIHELNVEGIKEALISLINA